MRYYLVCLTTFLAACAHIPALPTTPAPVAQPTFSERKLAVSEDGFCQVTRSGAIRCRQMDFFPSGPIEPPPSGSFRQIVSHDQGFCALAESGRVECWQNSRSMYQARLNFVGEYTEIASTRNVVCALRTDGALECAGPVPHMPRDNPVVVAALEMPEGRYTRVTGGYSICAITTLGRAHCYQPAFLKAPEDRKGGIANTRYHERLDDRAPYVKAVQTRHWGCALSETGRVDCMASFFQQHVARAGHDVPLQLETFRDQKFTDLMAGRRVCARRTSGAWLCEDEVEMTPDVAQPAMLHQLEVSLHGIDEHGRLHTLTESPEGVFTSVYRGHTICGVRDDDTVFCADEYRPYDDYRLENLDGLNATEYYLVTPQGRVGLNRESDKGDGVVHGRRDPRNDAQKGYVDVQHGNDFGCGLRDDGRVKCWGSITGSKRRAKPPGDKMAALALGGVYACGITRDEGAVKCWGNTYFMHAETAPTGGGFTELRTTYLNTCATRQDGSVACWGRAFWGKTFELPFTPRSYALTEAGVCALDESQTLHCWGNGIVWNSVPARVSSR